jgi:hypothetical protein
VRRSAVRMWLLAILAVPFILFGADVLLEQRFVRPVLDLIHPDGEVPGIETRDLAWAWAFVLGGGATAAWSLKELIAPRKIVTADEEGLTFSLGGPFSKTVSTPWIVIDAVRSAQASDDGDVFPVLVVEFLEGSAPRSLPAWPWGARWIDTRTLAIAASEFDRPVSRIAVDIEALRPEGGLSELPEEIGAGDGAPDAPMEPLPEPSPVPEPVGAGSQVRDDVWTTFDDVPDRAGDAVPESDQAPEPEMPSSPLMASHWIILDEPEED